VIENERLQPHIIADAASKRRFTDYAIKRLVKQTMITLIEDERIDPYKPVRLMLNIDQQSTKSNGYYGLDQGIAEDLLHGVHNFNYHTYYKPILYEGLDLELRYCRSDKNYAIQASDLVAGTIRKNLLQSKDFNEKKSFVKVGIYLP
jgi:hypothetical protein